MNLLRSILLIDDDEVTNYLHKKLILESGFFGEIVDCTSAEDALVYLTSARNGSYPKPDIIFLDIGMPVMDAWGFLSQYEYLPKDQKGHGILVILTSSTSPEDKIKASATGQIADYLMKPLTAEILQSLYNKHFSNIKPGSL